MAAVTAVNSLGGFEHNPRGNIWLNDDSTVGHKLLMKMGWSKGKGLGKNEDGIQENIKVKVKSLNSGVGYKDESFFKLQCTEYDSLLKSISDSCSPQNKVLENGDKTSKEENGSLEQRSQAFRNRLHYQRFVRGKDLSKYSEKDMKGIFILSKKSEEQKIPSVPKDSSSSRQNYSDPPEGPCLNVIDSYKSNLSISEYFSLKMKGKKNLIDKKAVTQSIDPVSEKLEKENATSAKEEKMLDATGGETTIMMEEEPSSSAVTDRKHKRKRSKEVISYRNEADIGEANGIYDLKSDNSLKSSKKRKKSKMSPSICSESVISDRDDNLIPISFAQNVDLPQLAVIENTHGTLLKNEKDSGTFLGSEKDSIKKQIKSQKHKHKPLKFLKSCLKSKSSQYSVVKDVSFSENVSYKIIDSEPECHLDPPVSSLPEIECIVLEPENNSDNTASVEQDVQMDTQAADSETCVEAEKIKKNNIFLSYPPHTHSGSSYDPWVESQRQAKKMKLYKNMLKNIKKHDILKSTNLLFIQGYGNWDY